MYHIICDESYTKGRFLVLGALVLPRHNHEILTREFGEWKAARGLNIESEFKWTKVSRRYLQFYEEMMRWFVGHVAARHMRFRSLIMDTQNRFFHEFCEGDNTRGFYKAYYHLLLQCMKDILATDRQERALILLDEKRERYPFYKQVLKKTLNGALKRDLGVQAAVANIEDRRSSGLRGEQLIQPIDVMIGAIGFVRNATALRQNTSEAKRALVETIEQAAGSALLYDTLPTSPLNIWTFDLRIAAVRKHIRKTAPKRKRPQA